MNEWQPIESAPEADGYACIGAVELSPDNWAVGEMHYVASAGLGHGWWWAGNDPTDVWGCEIFPAFFMPLPAPPLPTSGDAQ